MNAQMMNRNNNKIVSIDDIFIHKLIMETF